MIYQDDNGQYVASIYYDFVDVDDMVTRDANAKGIVGKAPGSSGCGIGKRDLQFYFNSHLDAVEAHQDLILAGFEPVKNWL